MMFALRSSQLTLSYLIYFLEHFFLFMASTVVQRDSETIPLFPAYRCCSCCCSKSQTDVEVASDDEKGRMLTKDNNAVDGGHNAAAAPPAAGAAEGDQVN